ncbi:hypothetical protein [Williamsia sp. DF01-3]|uniref:hypothetical protein n=1 Tax=Williamsia sp. DF01-3 TaxID=2934157 RepID=UPI001FF3A210|nr:hypothetical protein [Williamsia sp. DF01-3]MCK0517849.1 hypothetical protein [Williamsia sp. DF01-3]
MSSELDRLRFAVGDPDGARSSTWRVWTVKKSADVYVAVRTIAGIEKVSLHESGNYAYGVTEQVRAHFVEDGESRLHDTWTRPDSDHGWHRGFAIRFPIEDLRPLPDEERNGVAFVAPGEVGAVQISIFIGTSAASKFEVTPVENELGRLRIGGAGGQVVAAVQRNPDFTSDVLTGKRDWAIGKIRAERPDIKLSPTMRMGMLGSDQATGERFLYDLSCDI